MITTVTLAQGAVQMAREKVIVKHLSAIQNLGSIDILCSDKTGTLTTGILSVERATDPFGRDAERPLGLAALNAAFQTGVKSPLDVAILRRPPPDLDQYVKTDEIPFDFERRRVSVVLARAGTFMLVAKGAPEGVLDACTHYDVDGDARTHRAGEGALPRVVSHHECRGAAGAGGRVSPRVQARLATLATTSAISRWRGSSRLPTP